MCGEFGMVTASHTHTHFRKLYRLYEYTGYELYRLHEYNSSEFKFFIFLLKIKSAFLCKALDWIYLDWNIVFFPTSYFYV